MRRVAEDRGISAIWVALVLLFLVGATALAVDGAGAFTVAQTDQNTADLACLAGVKELPSDSTSAIDTTVDYVGQNWPAMSGQTLTVTGTTADYFDGAGNAVFIDVAYAGDPSKEYVRVTEIKKTWFARLMGADTVTVVQEAWCRVEQEGIGGGGLPFGAQPGGFNGNLQKLNPCETGNCGPLVIDRDDVNGTSATLIKNIAFGPDRLLAAKWGTPDSSTYNCWDVNAGDTCHIVKTDTGVSASHLGEGMLQRLERLGSNPSCTTFFNSREFNCDSPSQILGTGLTPLFTAFPGGFWDVQLYGPYNAASTANHYYFNGVIQKCDSPRLGFMPIVSEDMNWKPGDPWPPFPNGKKNVKVVGFYWVIITDPNDPGDWKGAGVLKRSAADVIWFGPGTTCFDDTEFDPSNPTVSSELVLLVNDTN